MFSSLEKIMGRTAKELFDDVPHLLCALGGELLTEGQRVVSKAFLGVEAKEGEKDAQEAPRHLLRGTVPLGKVQGKWSRRTVYFPKGDNRHKIVVGATGAGKTEWAKNYVVSRPGGVAYMDNTDGSGAESILKALPRERLEKTVLLDHSNKHWPLPMGMAEKAGDVFAEDAITAQWVAFFEANFEVEGQYMTTELIAYACKAVFSVPGCTILDVVRIVQEEPFREWVLNRVHDKDTLKWWRERFGRLSENEQKQVRASFLRRAGILFQDRVLKYTLGQAPAEPLPYRKWMDEGYTVIIKATEGLSAATVRTIMALHALNFWRAALSREDTQKRTPFMLIADEPQTWLSKNADTLDDIFSKARKYGFGIMCLFQSFKQVAKESPALLRIMLDNYPDLVVFRTSKEQAQLPFNPEELPKYHFGARVDGSEWFTAKAPALAKAVRQNVIPFKQAQRERWNQDWQRVQNDIDRREHVCQDAVNISGQGPESQSSGLGSTWSHGSRKETGESSGSSLIFD